MKKCLDKKNMQNIACNVIVIQYIENFLKVIYHKY